MLISRPGLGVIHHDAWELDKKLREGDGAMWPGDSHLTLELAVVKAKDEYGNRHTGRRYEVWRACEDGQDRLIGHWLLEEKDMILHDVAKMSLQAPAHQDTLESMRAANKQAEGRSKQLYWDAMGGMLDHAARLALDLSSHEPKTTFRGIPGSRDD